MGSARVAQYWSETLGVSPEELVQPGILVVPHSKKLSGRNASWIFVHEDTCVISVPPGLVDELHQKAIGIPIESIQSPDSTHALFGDRIRRTVGPAYQGYAEAEDFRPCTSHDVRSLSDSDRPLLQRLADACGPVEWQNSGINVDDENLFGCFGDGKIVAASGIIPWANYAANIGVITHPDYRRRGYGKAVASRAMQHILDQGDLVLYQTLVENVAAVRIAESLGCKAYAQTTYIAFKD